LAVVSQRRLTPSASVLILLLLSACLAPSSVLPSSPKKMRQLSREEVAKVWVGFTEDEAYLLRLSLSPDGTGQAGYVYVDGEPKVAQITSWSYESPIISIAIAGNLTFQRLEGKIVGNSMALKASGRGWESRIYLRLEGVLQPRWEWLRSSMNAIENPQPKR
jgi:hypothetical protein